MLLLSPAPTNAICVLLHLSISFNFYVFISIYTVFFLVHDVTIVSQHFMLIMGIVCVCGLFMSSFKIKIWCSRFLLRSWCQQIYFYMFVPIAIIGAKKVVAFTSVFYICNCIRAMILSLILSSFWINLSENQDMV